MITNKYNIGDRLKFKSSLGLLMDGTVLAIFSRRPYEIIDYNFTNCHRQGTIKNPDQRYIPESDIIELLEPANGK